MRFKTRINDKPLQIFLIIYLIHLAITFTIKNDFEI